MYKSTPIDLFYPGLEGSAFYEGRLILYQYI